MSLGKQIVIGLCIVLAAVAVTGAVAATTFLASLFMSERSMRLGSVFATVIVGAIVVWFYFFQRDIANKRFTLRSLLGLVVAVGIGAKIGLIILANAP